MKSYLKLGVAIIIPVLLISACQLFRKSPEEIVRNAMQKLASETRYQAEFVLDGVGVAPEGEIPARVDFDITIDGYFDSKDQKKPLSELTLEAGLKLDEERGDISVAFRQMENAIYLKLNSINIPQLTALFPPETMNQFIEQWWTFEVDAQSPRYVQLTEEQEAIRAKLGEISLFKEIREVDKEQLRGAETTRYSVTVDKEALLEFFTAVASAGETTLSPEEKGAVRDRLEEIDFTGDVWVSNNGAVNQIAGLLHSTPAQGGSFEIDVKATFWDFGKEKVVETPTDAKEFNPALLFGGLGASLLPGGLGSAAADELPIDEPLGAEQIEEGDE